MDFRFTKDEDAFRKDVREFMGELKDLLKARGKERPERRR